MCQGTYIDTSWKVKQEVGENCFTICIIHLRFLNVYLKETVVREAYIADWGGEKFLENFSRNACMEETTW
jgi:hypothetical protein